MNTSEVFFCPLPWMKDSNSNLVLIFLPRKRSFILARMLLFINCLMEKHSGLWNSTGYFPLSEISIVPHAGKQQLQTKWGGSKSKQYYPLHLPWNREDAVCRHCVFLFLLVCQCFPTPAFTTHSLLCFTESFFLLLPLPFLSPVSLDSGLESKCFPFMSLQFIDLESFTWDRCFFILPITFLLPSDKPWSISTPT